MINPATEKQPAIKIQIIILSYLILLKEATVFSGTLLYLSKWRANGTIHSVFQATNRGERSLHSSNDALSRDYSLVRPSAPNDNI